ncbi:hypothetical protein HLB44_14830 [Aquincola sp. S2]|uniref:Uncharacterized protein n=1 Tax=Pseudaquabacterium terrae TaxID=2732868 RepID=A0ABX2EHY0_9BURK|nr:hypothetical protein [Aquabacterium terrae]NRF68265.1 hypothetical protein [Aquabacterium terrae]
MIQVQIAATLERSGVSAVRWVLVDPDESARTAPAEPAQRVRSEPEPVSPRPGRTVHRASLGVRVASAVVLLSALGGAWSVASALQPAAAPARPAATR